MPDPPDELRTLYLDLLKQCLTMMLWDAADGSQGRASDSPGRRVKEAIRMLVAGGRAPGPGARERRKRGRDWPKLAHTMIGLERMDNLQFCVEDTLRRGVPGDFIETGVWRGGACIFMRGILAAHLVRDRLVWVADSFAGLPAADAVTHQADARDGFHEVGCLAVPLDEVKANFARYGLLDDQVRFLEGWFKDTLPAAPIERLAVARLDGDMYESTMDSLRCLWPKLSVGGYLIVDDYGVVTGCRQAVEDYRAAQSIADPIQPIDGWGVFWQRTR